MVRWMIYLGFVAALLGSVYLGRIATTRPMTEGSTWEATGYGIVQD